jgi:hypothetical protein
VKRLAPLALAALVLGGGCFGYRLGSSLPAGIRTIHVPTFRNQTGDPLIEAQATLSAIQEFQKDGTLKVVEAAEADVRLDVKLIAVELGAVSHERDSSRTVNEYRLRMDAEVVLVRSRTNAELLRRTVKGDTLFQPTGDLTLDKRNATPKATENLAHQIVQTVVEFW